MARDWRACPVVLVALLTCVCPLLAQVDYAAHRQAAQVILADELTAEVELAEELRMTQPPRDEIWPDAEVLYLALTASGHYVDGSVIVHEPTGKLIGFVAPEPEPPVPMEVMPAEEALPVAEEFCRRHLPELFAEGGEVSATTDEGITRLGGRRVHLQREEKGVKVLTLADVGVRVYDGKVVYFRRKHEPLEEGLELPGEVTLERAKQIAADDMPWENFDPLLWFDEVHEVVSTPDGQRNVWTVWAEIKTKGADNNRLEYFNRWRIDASSGEVVDSSWSKPFGELVLRYEAAGGTHVSEGGRPSPPTMLWDARPVWSPDGSKILFLSDRARPGYPDWYDAPPGLFVINADGTDLKCLVPSRVADPAWSPDGERIAYTSGGKLCIIPAGGGEALEFEPPEPYGYSEAAWNNASQLVVYKLRGMVDGQLLLLDLERPEAEPRPLGAPHKSDVSFSALSVTADGRTLYFARWKHETPDDEWDLLKLDLTAEGAEPEVVSENPREGRAGQLIGTDRMLLWDDRATPDRGPMWMVDLTTGQGEQWRPPRIPMPGTEGRWQIVPDGVYFSVDGQTMLFAGRLLDAAYEKPSARLIWTSNLDGSDLRQVTPWENAVVPIAGE
jgi:hypothetical protein